MQVLVTGTECPHLPGTRVGLQRGREVVDARPAAGGELRWSFEVPIGPGPRLRGPYVHGRGDERFLYLVWERDGTGMFRRAKLMLDAVPADALAAAVTLSARLPLTLPDGSPVCAAVRPPRIAWDLR